MDLEPSPGSLSLGPLPLNGPNPGSAFPVRHKKLNQLPVTVHVVK